MWLKKELLQEYKKKFDHYCCNKRNVLSIAAVPGYVPVIEIVDVAAVSFAASFSR